MATEIENVERLRRQLRKEKEELEMWKQTCDHLENGKRLNKIYEKALQKLMNDSDGHSENNQESSSLPKVILKRYDDLLSDWKELLQITDKVLENEYSKLENEDPKGMQEQVRQDVDKGDKKGVSPSQSDTRPLAKVKPIMTPVRELKVESQSNTTILSDNSSGNKSARSIESFSRAENKSPPRSRAERREQRDRPWARSLDAEYLDKTPAHDHSSRSLYRSWSRLSRSRSSSGKRNRDKTLVSGREILVGDHPWGAKMKREKTWCAPGRDRNKQNITREEKRMNRDRPWVLSKEKKEILRQNTFYDLPMARAETAFGDRPKSRSKSEMKRYDKNYSGPVTRSEKTRPGTRADHVTPLQNDLSPKANRKSRMTGREVSFSLGDDTQSHSVMNNRSQPTLTRSLDTPLAYYNLNLDESVNEGSDDKTRPDTRVNSVSPLQLGESLNLGRQSPGSPTEAWLFSPKSRPTERDISFYKSPDLAIAGVEASNRPHNQFIPKKKIMKTPRNRTRSKGKESLDSYGGTMRSWSTEPHGPRPDTRAEGLRGPTVWQLKPRETRPHTRGNPLEMSARENYSTRRY